MRKRFEELFEQQDAVDGLLAELAKERHELEEKYIKLCGTRRLTVFCPLCIAHQRGVLHFGSDHGLLGHGKAAQ